VVPSVTPLLSTPALTLGRYRCPPEVSAWQEPNDIGPLAHVVFPERPVTITRDTTGPLLGDRNWVMLYDPGQQYARQLVDPEGDECTFLALSPTLHDDLMSSGEQARQAFRAGRALVGTGTWLGYQECLAAADRAARPGGDPLDVESRLLEVLLAVLQDGRGDVGAAPARSVRGAASRGRTQRRVHDACAILATHLDERLTISAVADAVGLSAYHFCRQFRAATGLTVHAYRERLRLRQAFATCTSAPGQKLSDVAVAAGYASHSHMTTRFREALRMSPTDVRDRYAGASSVAMRSGLPTIY